MSSKEHDKLWKAIEATNKKMAENHKEVMKTLEPIADTYKTASKLWKWLVALGIFISVAMQIIINWGKIAKMFFTNHS